MKILKSNSIKLWFFIILASITGGSIPTFAKFALEDLGSFTLVLLRFASATLFLLPFAFKTKIVSFKMFKDLWFIALIAALNPILLFIALNSTQASFAPIIYSIVPILTAIYLFIFEKRKTTRIQSLGLLLGFVGAALVILTPIISSTNLGNESLVGNILILFAAFAVMLYGIKSKKAQTNKNISPLALTFYFSLVTMFLSIPFAGIEVYTNPLDSVSALSIFSGLYVGIVGTGIFYLAYQYAIKNGNEISAAMFTYLQPIVGVLLPFIFLNEVISFVFIIGAVLVLFGAGLVTGRFKVGKKGVDK